MRILFVTDLHGNTWKYERLLPAARRANAVLVINGGDMLPHGRNLPRDQRDFVEGHLALHLREFNEAGIRYLFCPGNDDLMALDGLIDSIAATSPLAQNIAGKKIDVGGCEFIGMNWIVDCPFRLKDRCRMDTARYVFQQQLGTALLSTESGFTEVKDWFEYARALPTVEDELNALVSPADPRRAIYVIHMPPARCGLDVCDNGLKVGSEAIYDFLWHTQPLMSLHGHIHESPAVSGVWKKRIGETLSVQPGQERGFTYAIIDLEEMSVSREVEEA